MADVDLKKVYREHYTAGRTPALVEVPSRPYLMVDGTGDPNTAPAYREAVETLYPLAYGLRAAVKQQTGDAYTVMPLEGLWWVPDLTRFSYDDRSDWHWTMMICLPEVVTEEMAAEVLPAVTAKKQLPAGEKVRFDRHADGEAAQVLHVGPYSEEPPTIAALHRFIEEQGYALTGRHHEIYLSDARKTDPARLRTILRQPVARA